MFHALSKVFDVFLSPLTWVLVLCLLGMVRRYERWTRWAPAAAAATLYLFSTAFVSNALLRHLENAATRTMRDGIVYDAALLLGGAVAHGSMHKWGTRSYNDNVERLLTTYDLLRSGRVRSVIISGGRGDPDDPIVEAHVLGKQLEDWGIEPERIVLEDRARNTRENATESKRIAAERRFSSLLMITSARHVLRALESFRRVGLAVDTLPVDYRSTDNPHAFRSLLPRTDDLDISVHSLREIFGGWIYKAAF